MAKTVAETVGTGMDWLDDLWGGVPVRRLAVVVWNGIPAGIAETVAALRDRGIASAVVDGPSMPVGYWTKQQGSMSRQEQPLLFIVTGLGSDVPEDLVRAAHFLTVRTT